MLVIIYSNGNNNTDDVSVNKGNNDILTTNAEGMAASCSKGSSLRQSSRAVLFNSGDDAFTPGQLNASPITAAFFLWSHLSAQGLRAVPDWSITRLNKPKSTEWDEISK